MPDGDERAPTRTDAAPIMPDRARDGTIREIGADLTASARSDPLRSSPCAAQTVEHSFVPEQVCRSCSGRPSARPGG